MSIGIRLLILGLGLVFFMIIFEMVRRKKFREELSVTWFIISIAIMASSVADKIIDPLARTLGIGYPPALIFIWVVFFLLLALLYFSLVISDLKGKVKELSQKIALIEHEISRIRKP
ncbi:MAG: DUF2304 domain-containing protein [Nitrospirota bacterium]